MNITNFKEFKPVGKQKKKKQIVLIHSSRPADDYLEKLRYRNNGNYTKIPNYLVSKKGKVIKLLDDQEYSNIFTQENINKNSIVVCLENLGWLEKEPLKNSYINWIGNIYTGEVVEKKWRDYFIWQPYSSEQMDSLVELCGVLMKKFKMN